MSSSLPAHPSSFPGDRGGGEIIRGAGGQATERGGMNASSQQHHQQHAYFSYPPAYHSSHAAGGHYMAPGGGGADQPQQQVLTRRRDDRGERYFSPMSPAGGGGGGGVVDRGVYTPGYHNYTQDGTTTHLLYEERGRGAGWTYGGPGGGRREEGEEEMSRGIGGDGAYAGGGGGGHRESIRRKGDVGGRKKAKPRSKKKDRKVTWFVSVYTVVLLVLFVGCAVSGVFVGIIVTSPTVRLASSSLQLDHGWSNNPNQIYSNSSSWSFRVAADKQHLEMGGEIEFLLPLLNPSVFTLEFTAPNLSVFYYPIGSSMQCLLYHGGVIGSRDQPTGQYRELFADPANGRATRFVSPPSMRVPTTDSRYSAKSEAVFRVVTSFGLRVPPSLYSEAKPLYEDCVNHKMLILAVEIRGAYTVSPLTKVAMPGPIEIMTILRCNIEENVDTLLQAAPKTYQSVIFRNLQNDKIDFSKS